MVVRKRALARLGLPDRDAGRLAERAQLLSRFGVDDAAAGDHERPPCAANRVDRGRERRRVGRLPRHVPRPFGEEILGAVERLGLDVLRERERHGARLAGLVRTRIAASAAGITCSGREIRSKYRETGRNASFTDTSPAHGTSSCCSTGSGAMPREHVAGERAAPAAC